MLWKRARDSGKGSVVLGFLGVENGVAGLQKGESRVAMRVH